MKQRLILVIGADSKEEISNALLWLGNERLECNCIGVMANGADFDYQLDTTDGSISLAQVIREIESGAWKKPNP